MLSKYEGRIWLIDPFISVFIEQFMAFDVSLVASSFNLIFRGGGGGYTNCCSSGPIIFKLGQNFKLSKCFKLKKKKFKMFQLLMTSSLFFGENLGKKKICL